MAENHTEVKVSNSCRASRTAKSSGSSRRNCTTPLGFEERCGTSEPGIAAIASRSSSTSAVRMLVSWRHKKRTQPDGVQARLGSTPLALGRAGVVVGDQRGVTVPPITAPRLETNSCQRPVTIARPMTMSRDAADDVDDADVAL